MINEKANVFAATLAAVALAAGGAGVPQAASERIEATDATRPSGNIVIAEADSSWWCKVAPKWCGKDDVPGGVQNTPPPIDDSVSNSAASPATESAPAPVAAPPPPESAPAAPESVPGEPKDAPQ